MNHIGKLKSDIYYAQVLNTKLLHRKTNHRNQKIESTASASHPTSCIINNVAHQNSTLEFIFTSRVNQFNLTMTAGDEMKCAWFDLDCWWAVGPLSNHLLAVALQNLGNLHLVATGRSRKTASSSSPFRVIIHESSCRGSGGRAQ